jgi:CRP-like cAMP-binding protein
MNAEIVEGSLPQLGILSFISPGDLDLVKTFGVFKHYKVGSLVLAQGVEQDSLHFLCSGRLEVLHLQAGQEFPLGTAEPVDCVGEISVFESGVTSATVRVLEPALVWELSSAGLRRFNQEYPVICSQLMLGIVQLLSRRLRLADKEVAASRLMPVHLSVRARARLGVGEAELPEDEKESGGILGFKRKDDYKLPARIKL